VAKKKTHHRLSESELEQRFAASGLRSTTQRKQVYAVMNGELNHPTAEEIFLKAKATTPDISMATVYNCLDRLVKCDLVREVRVERSASRYCPNMQEHCHFHCNDCGRIFDIDLNDTPAVPEACLPRGFKADSIDISMRGRCPDKGCSVNGKN
jgi:Fe2+ or Zn2+ uptake regulation protein